MLHVHRAVRADALVPPLAAVLATPAPDPFAAEVLAVPTKGVERWLAQRLSHHLGASGTEAGVCANVRFDSPGAIVRGALTQLRAGSGAGEEDPWRPEALAWSLAAVLGDVLERPWAAPLHRYLSGGEDPRGRRLTLARRLADLFAAYGAARPDLVLAWSATSEGRSGFGPAAGPPDTDGAGLPLPEDLAWQPHLWRAVEAAVGGGDPPPRPPPPPPPGGPPRRAPPRRRLPALAAWWSSGGRARPRRVRTCRCAGSVAPHGVGHGVSSRNLRIWRGARGRE
ncbi:MAG: exodeoxyribonuclease V subunit gamma [Kineosporiaceae bacterium]